MAGARALELLSPHRLAALATSRTGVLALTTGGTLVVRTVSSVILTRLLSPAAFGVVGIINSIFFAIAMLTDLGFQSYVVRHERGDEPRFLDVIWTIHASRGAALTALAAAGSPLIAWALGKPELALPLAVASGTFLLNGATSLSLMTALRHDGARKLSLLEFGVQLFQTLACLLLAWWWRNAWSIIVTLLLQGLLRAILSYALYPGSGRRPARDRAISAEFLAFSRVVLVSSSLALIVSQSDKLALARLLTLDQYGLYAIALNLASAPVAFADAYISRVTFPIYARIWREAPAALPKAYYGVRRLPSLLYAFGSGGLLGGAGLLVAILYDPRYAPAAPYLSLLMVSSALRFPNFAAAELMTATGEIRVTLRGNAVRVGWLLLAGPAGYLAFGIIGVIGAVGLLEVPALFYNWAVLRRVGILDLREEMLFVGLLCGGGAAGFAIASAALRLLPLL